MSSSSSSSSHFVFTDCSDPTLFALTVSYLILTVLVLFLIILPLFIRYFHFDLDCCPLLEWKERQIRKTRLQRQRTASFNNVNSSPSPQQQQLHSSSPPPITTVAAPHCTTRGPFDGINSDSEYISSPSPSPSARTGTRNTTTERTTVMMTEMSQSRTRSLSRNTTTATIITTSKTAAAGTAIATAKYNDRGTYAGKRRVRRIRTRRARLASQSQSFSSSSSLLKCRVILHISFFASAIVSLLLNVYWISRICLLRHWIPAMASAQGFCLFLHTELLSVVLFYRLHFVFKESAAYRLSKSTTFMMISLFCALFVGLCLWVIFNSFYRERYKLLVSLILLSCLALQLIALITATFMFVKKLYLMVKDIGDENERERNNKTNTARQLLPVMVKSTLLIGMPMAVMVVNVCSEVVLKLANASVSVSAAVMSMLILILLVCDYLSVALLLQSNHAIYQTCCGCGCDQLLRNCMERMVSDIRGIKMRLSVVDEQQKQQPEPQAQQDKKAVTV